MASPGVSASIVSSLGGGAAATSPSTSISTSIDPIGTNSGDFEVLGFTPGSPVVIPATLDGVTNKLALDIKFTPMGVGMRGVNITIGTDQGVEKGGDGQIFQVAASGEGVDPGTGLLIHTPLLDFGNVRVGTTSAPMDAEVQNNGGPGSQLSGNFGGVNTGFGPINPLRTTGP